MVGAPVKHKTAKTSGSARASQPAPPAQKTADRAAPAKAAGDRAAARASTTSALADRLRQRSDARAARSVEEGLLATPVAPLATVTELVPPILHAPSAAEPASAADRAGLDPGVPATPTDPDPAGTSPTDGPTAAPGATANITATDGPAPTPDAVPDEPPSGKRPAGPVRPARKPRAVEPAEPTATVPVSAPVSEPVTKPVAGPDGRLQLSGERVAKMTLELPIPLVDALARWERDETAATGQRVYRERLIDCALSQLPDDTDELVAMARALPDMLRTADTEQVGTRVRESIQRRLKNLRPELRVRRVRDVYLRHIYAAAIAQYLTALGVALGDPA